jgi:biotin carboxyl carrier protein
MKTYKMHINGQPFEAKIVRYDNHSAVVNVNGTDYAIDIDQEETTNVPKLVRAEKTAASVNLVSEKTVDAKAGDLLAPIPGLVLNVLVKEGDSVTAGQPVILLEAMKMESEIPSPSTGKIKAIHKHKGDSVQEGELLLEIAAG